MKNICYFVIYTILLCTPCILHAAQGNDASQRIVSFSPGITEQIYLLGAEDGLVGVSQFSHRPGVCNEKERVGTCIKPDVERVIELRPDLVIAPSFLPASIQALWQQCGIRVVRMEYVTTFEQLCAQSIQLGELVGKKEKAQEMVVDAREELVLIRDSIRGKRSFSVFFQLGSNPLFAVTKNSLLHAYIEAIGATNTISTSRDGMLNKEQVLALDPDMIVMIGMTKQQDVQKMWNNYPQLRAVQRKKIIQLDADKACNPNPATFVEVVRELLQNKT